ncbi:ATP-dependent DNA helicase pif1 [Eumeta japonica]|uniref:ATP-dependent DNA helicase n=1 Tax=Eumeta variegata TaxID=151549 RepID=A0A4C1V2W1_EUMVA|nr:ATP-dependent DNA helicase pif1 [Eumeta japonica]
MVADNYKIVIRADKRPAGQHERRFNAPQTNEVAVVIVDNECSSRDLLFNAELFQQFIADMYAKIETERLEFIRHNQRKLRSDEYIHLRDAIINDGKVDNMGKLVILPSTFTGSPRHVRDMLKMQEIMTENTADQKMVKVFHYRNGTKSCDGTTNTNNFNSFFELCQEDSFAKTLLRNAPGGTGKTFLINLILAEIRANKEIVLALASSGIAATLMDGGRTAHSGLKLPLNVADYEFPVCDITKSSARGQILKQCKAIIWDESTMAHRKSLEALNRTLQDLRDNTNVIGEWLRERIILATKNDIVNGINNIIQEMIPGRENLHVNRYND